MIVKDINEIFAWLALYTSDMRPHAGLFVKFEDKNGVRTYANARPLEFTEDYEWFPHPNSMAVQQGIKPRCTGVRVTVKLTDESSGFTEPVSKAGKRGGRNGGENLFHVKYVILKDGSMSDEARDLYLRFLRSREDRFPLRP